MFCSNSKPQPTRRAWRSRAWWASPRRRSTTWATRSWRRWWRGWAATRATHTPSRGGAFIPSFLHPSASVQSYYVTIHGPGPVSSCICFRRGQLRSLDSKYYFGESGVHMCSAATYTATQHHNMQWVSFFKPSYQNESVTRLLTGPGLCICICLKVDNIYVLCNLARHTQRSSWLGNNCEGNCKHLQTFVTKIKTVIQRIGRLQWHCTPRLLTGYPYYLSTFHTLQLHFTTYHSTYKISQYSYPLCVCQKNVRVLQWF